MGDGEVDWELGEKHVGLTTDLSKVAVLSEAYCALHPLLLAKVISVGEYG